MSRRRPRPLDNEDEGGRESILRRRLDPQGDRDVVFREGNLPDIPIPDEDVIMTDASMQPTQQSRIPDLMPISQTAAAISRRATVEEEYRRNRAMRIAQERERLREEQQAERERLRDQIFNRNRRDESENGSPLQGMTDVQTRQPDPITDRRVPAPAPMTTAVANTTNNAKSFVTSGGMPVYNEISVDVIPYSRMMHFKHVMRVIDVCTGLDNENGLMRRWCGLATFLKYYFASTLKIFLGQTAVVRVFLMHSEREIGAKLYRVHNDRYVLSLLANFDYWEKIGTIAASLPDIYFRGPMGGSEEERRVSAEQLHCYGTSEISSRTGLAFSRDEAATAEYLQLNDVRIPIRDGHQVSAPSHIPQMQSAAPTAKSTTKQRAQQQPNLSSSSPEQEQSRSVEEEIEVANSAVIDQAMMALCLVHLFEVYIQRDLKNKVPNYVTLAKLFSNNSESINPFRIEWRVR
jgi:hypothetical protein